MQVSIFKQTKKTEAEMPETQTMMQAVTQAFTKATKSCSENHYKGGKPDTMQFQEECSKHWIQSI